MHIIGTSMCSQKFVIIDIYVFIQIVFPPRYAEMHANTTAIIHLGTYMLW